MYGFRSCHAPDAQNWPTLSSVNERTASGGVAGVDRGDDLLVVDTPTLFTVIQGISAVNPSKILLNCWSSRPVHALHIVNVTGVCEVPLPVSIAEGVLELPNAAVHAAVTSTNVIMAMSHRFMFVSLPWDRDDGP